MQNLAATIADLQNQTEMWSGAVLIGCKKANNPPSIIDTAIKDLICKKLELLEFDEQAVRRKLSRVLIKSDSSIDMQHESTIITCPFLGFGVII